MQKREYYNNCEREYFNYGALHKSPFAKQTRKPLFFLKANGNMNNGYAICYKEWILDKDIKNEIQLLLLISNLCAKLGYCYAGNKYFADMFDCTEVSISTKLRKLCDKNYIEINYTKRGCEIVERKIRLKNFLTDDLKKFEPTIKKDFKENNININNIKEKEKEKEKEKDDPKPPLPDGGQADFVSFEEQRKKDYELAELTKKKIQADLIKKFGV